jgi:two-component system cell cycle response regulator CtrA
MTETERLLKQENRILRNEIESLREELATLRAELCAPDWVAPIELKLTAKESQVLGCLCTQKRVLSKEALLRSMYDSRCAADEIPELKIVDVFICKIRRKLKPYGISIETSWGNGYYLTDESRSKLTELCQSADSD